MNVLTIYAHHNPRSFCHAVLERFTSGLRDAGHTNEVLDLHAMRFNPVLCGQDWPNWIDDSVPDDVLDRMNMRKELLHAAGGPLRRLLMKRWMGDKDARGLVRALRKLGGPRDVAFHQEKVAQAEALAFISPVYFVGFPAILKGWIERVFTLGFAFSLKPEAWRGDVRGRLPLLRHKKALIIRLPLKFFALATAVILVVLYGDIDVIFFLIGLSTVFIPIVLSQISFALKPADERSGHHGA